VKIRTFKPGDEAVQVAIYNEAAGPLAKFKAATLEDVSRRAQAKDFDPTTRLYADDNGKVVGYCSFHPSNGRIGYPWTVKGQETHAEALFQAALDELRKRGRKTAFAAYRSDWAPITSFFQSHDFRLVREMVNFVIDIVEMPTPAARPSLPFSPLKREDIPAIRDLAPEALRVSSNEQLEKHLFDNPYFSPDAVFVLRSRTGGLPAAVGILIDNAAYSDPKQVDPMMPCFRLGAFGTEGMEAKRINGLFSFLCRAGRDVSSMALDLMGHAAFRLEETSTAWLGAQVPSDVPHLLRFYQQHFRRQGSFPVFERTL
jgi:L-amino acid N-acyltransferase YncA